MKSSQNLDFLLGGGVYERDRERVPDLGLGDLDLSSRPRFLGDGL